MPNPPKTTAILPWIIVGIITLAIGAYFRLYPLTHNVASDEYEQATMMVLTKIRATITAEVNARFPQMPAPEKHRLIQERFNETLRKNNAKVRQTFDLVGQELIKKTGTKKHYLQESDSYYFLDLTQNILEKGDVSAKVNGSQYFNEKMLAPVGYWEPQTWHPYIGAWVYQALHALDPKVDLMTALGFTPIVLLPLVIAGFLMACRGLGCSWPSAFTASVFFILAPMYLQRSTYAWYDNDTYSVLFPVINLGLLFFALRPGNKLKNTLFWGVLAGLSFGLYARFWTGWAFSWGISLAAIALITLRTFLLKETSRRHMAVLLATVTGTTLLFLIASMGVKQFLALFPFAFGELKKFTMPEFKGWPDLFIVVGELHPTTWRETIALIGGPVTWGGAIFAFIATIRGAIMERKSPPDRFILLFMFAATTFVLAISAQRFTILLITPLCLALACGLEIIWEHRFIQIAENSQKKILLGIFLILTLIPVTVSERTIASLLHPIFNSAWDRALTQLKERSPANSVINTWWAPGHFVKAIAQRRVTFDGASIKGEQAYWLTQVYLSQNEAEAVGILRMLNTSSNQASEFLQKLGWPLSKAVTILKRIAPLSTAQAAIELNKILSPGETQELLKLTHGTPPPSYMLIYNEIVEGNVLLGYVGKWDFEKIEALNKNPLALGKVPRKGSRDYIDFLWALAGGQPRMSETLKPLGRQGSQMLFDQGVIIDSAAMSVSVNSPKFGHGIPASLVYLDDAAGKVVEKRFPDASLGYSALLFKDTDGTPRCVLMERSLANSLIMKMYYFDGKGLTHFKPFAREQTLSGRTRIFIYQVDWPTQ